MKIRMFEFLLTVSVLGMFAVLGFTAAYVLSGGDPLTAIAGVLR